MAATVGEAIDAQSTIAEQKPARRTERLVLHLGGLPLEPGLVGHRLCHLTVHAGAGARIDLLGVDAQFLPRLDDRHRRAAATRMRRRTRATIDPEHLAVI